MKNMAEQVERPENQEFQSQQHFSKRESSTVEMGKISKDDVRQRLSSELSLLQRQREKLRYDFEHNNCIRLDLIWRDWDGEEQDLRKALTGLDEGSVGQAVEYLNKQACRKQAEIKKMEMKATERSVGVEDAMISYSKQREALPVDAQVREKYLYGSEADINVKGRYQQLEAIAVEKRLRHEHPEWKNLAEVDSQVVTSERERIGRLRGLATSDFIAQRATDESLSAEERYVYLRYAELLANEEWLEESAQNVVYRRAYEKEISELSQMVQLLGGEQLSSLVREEQALQLLRSPGSELSPRQIYKLILQGADGLATKARVQIEATFQTLVQQIEGIDSDLESLSAGAPAESNKKLQDQRASWRYF
jgi:hypothetical protein